MYRADVSQSVDPASPNYGTLAKGEEARAAGAKYASDSTSTLLKAAETVIKTGVEIDLSRTDIKAEDLTKEFLSSNMVAEEDARQMGALTKPAPNSDSLVIDTYNKEFTRLRNASLGGMSNEEYVSRVSALSRKAIAKYPGLSDKIRERVGTITGLPYADQWAEMQFVKERFSKEKKDTAYDPMKAVMADIAATAPLGTFGGQEELLNLYNTDRKEYTNRMFKANQYRAMKTGVDSVTETIKGATAVSDNDADKARAGFVAMFEGHLSTSVLADSTKNLDSVYKPILELMAKGEKIEINPLAFDTQIKMHNASMKIAIEKAALDSTRELNAFFAKNPNISQEKRNSMTKDISDARDLNLRLYADDKGVGAAAMSTIMLSYRDKTLKEQRELVDLAIKQQGAMQNNSLVMAYWAGGVARENLKETNKSFYEFMVKQEDILTKNLLGTGRNDTGANQLQDVTNILKAATTSDGKPVTTVSPDVATTKAAHNVMYDNTKTALDKAVAGKQLTTQEAALISSTFSTNVSTGGMSQVFAADHVKLGAKIKLLPDAAQALIKSNVSDTSKSTVVAMSSLKDGIEAKYGVTIQLGVNDAGQLMAMPIKPVYTAQNQPDTRGAVPAIQTNVLDAVKEFNNKSKALSSNLVYSRVMLTGESILAVSKDYATLINNKQQYNGFFNMQPTAPTTPKATTTTTVLPSTTSAAGNTILNEIEALK